MLPNTQSTFMAQGRDFILKILKYLLTETIYSGFDVKSKKSISRLTNKLKDVKIKQNNELELELS